MSEPNFPGHQYFAEPGPAPVPVPDGCVVSSGQGKNVDQLMRIRALVAQWEQRARGYDERDSYEYADGVANTYHDVATALRDILED